MFFFVCVYEMYIYYMLKIIILWFKCDWYGSSEIRVNVFIVILILFVCICRDLIVFRFRIIYIDSLGREVKDLYF